ncbi:MAG: hypothetical protein RL385_1767 [Pseudomonadota bacterium]
MLKAKPDDAASVAAVVARLGTQVGECKAFTASKGSGLNTTFKGFADVYDRFDSKAQSFSRSSKEGAKPERLEQEYNQVVQA